MTQPLPRVPEGKRVYAVGDVHGRLDLLVRLQRQMEDDQAAHPGQEPVEIYLGDYVDRGPASAEVLETLLERRRARDVICLSGNHEQMMREAHRSFEAFPHWQRVGGFEAVQSYLPGFAEVAGVQEPHSLWQQWRGAVPARHLVFLESLGTYHVCGDYLFVHAGLRPGVPLENQRREDCLWIRHAFLDHAGAFGHMVVHGHTPTPEPQLKANRIGIDTGAFASGRLTCLVLDGAERALLST